MTEFEGKVLLALNRIADSLERLAADDRVVQIQTPDGENLWVLASVERSSCDDPIPVRVERED